MQLQLIQLVIDMQFNNNLTQIEWVIFIVGNMCVCFCLFSEFRFTAKPIPIVINTMNWNLYPGF